MSTLGIDREEEKFYKCKVCQLEFKDYRKLGGHFRKYHPGMSDHYKRMK